MSHRSPAPTLPVLTTAPTTLTSASKAPTGTLTWISWLRVAAIGAVVSIHVGGLTAVSPQARSTPEGHLGIFLDFASRWCVPVFVMISGALLLDPARYRGPANFLRRRALRLLPAAVVWHLIYLVYLLLFTSKVPDARTALELILTGRLYTALYFFWIVIGLAVVTPVLVQWVATSTRGAQLIVGLAAAAIPALTLLSVPVRTDGLWSADVSWVETPWTWWIPYLGYYLLGYALREVVLRGWRLGLALAGALVCSLLLMWQWGKTEGVAGLLERYTPAEAYYSPTVILLAVCVFLLAHALIRPGGWLSALCAPGPTVAGRRLGDSTLGVFVVHLLVLQVVLHMPIIGGAGAASSVPQLTARLIAVFVGAYLVSLLANRIPLLRRVF